MPLSDIELRVLGALIEKERTTPDGYPLSSQALLTACNQRTNRDPVTDYHLQDVLGAAQRLVDRGLAETVQGVGDRVVKHRHRAAHALGLDDRQAALLAVLLLRGPQTPGELRTRTERYTRFSDVVGVERVLAEMAAGGAPLVRRLGRGPGQSQDRYTHTLGADDARLAPRVRRNGGDALEDREGVGRPSAAASTARAAVGGEGRRLEELERQVERLSAELDRLKARVVALEDRA